MGKVSCIHRGQPLPLRRMSGLKAMVRLLEWLVMIVLVLQVGAGNPTCAYGAEPPPPLGAMNTTLPISVADIPQAAALRTAPRIALVIGNDQYGNPSWDRLRLAGADARAVAQALKARGFELIGGDAQLNVAAARFHQLLAVTEAAVHSKPGAIVAVFFAGHGFVDESRNFLVPTDAPESARAVPASIGVIEIARRLNAAGSGLTMMFLDACRTYGSGQTGGLAAEAVPDNTFVGFAALFDTASREPSGAEAGAHGYYTAALLQALDAGSDRLDDLHLAIAARVVAATHGAQSPVYRQGARMPAAPIRLAALDPQTVFALARQRGATAGEAAAAQCAATSDLRVIMAFASMTRVAGQMQFGPRDEPIDLATMERSCRIAHAAGHREAPILRGLALAGYIAAARDGHVTPATAVNTFSLLAEAGEAGDAFANFMLAALASSPRANLGLPPGAVRDRLLHAAEQNRPPITGMVGLVLWRPEMSALRSQMGLPHLPGDEDRGIQLFRRAILSGDPFVQPIAFALGKANSPVVAGLPLRDALRRAIRSDNAAGFYFEGVSVHQTLYYYAILDTMAGLLGPKDYAEGVRLILEAEPFVEALGRGIDRTWGIRGMASADALLWMAACALASGRDSSGAPLSGVIHSPQMAVSLFRRTSMSHSPTSIATINDLAAGRMCH